MGYARILQLVMKPVSPDQHSIHDGRIDVFDLYDLPTLDLNSYRGIICGMSADLRFLHQQQPLLEAWIRQGGCFLYSGHPVEPFLSDMPTWRKLCFHGLDDIWLYPLESHPLWEGIDRCDFLLRTGVPGTHSFEELLSIGVGGFYARNYLADLPACAKAITGLGPGKLPVDVSYPLGSGEVIVHCGNDLTTTVQVPGTSSEHFTERIYRYLEQS